MTTALQYSAVMECCPFTRNSQKIWLHHKTTSLTQSVECQTHFTHCQINHFMISTQLVNKPASQHVLYEIDDWSMIKTVIKREYRGVSLCHNLFSQNYSQQIKEITRNTPWPTFTGELLGVCCDFKISSICNHAVMHAILCYIRPCYNTT